MATKQTPKTTEDGKTTPEDEVREEQLDRTIEDTFPASDPPSTIPDPNDNPDEPHGSRERP